MIRNDGLQNSDVIQCINHKSPWFLVLSYNILLLYINKMIISRRSYQLLVALI